MVLAWPRSSSSLRWARISAAALLVAVPVGATEVRPDYLESLGTIRHDVIVLGEVHDNPAHHTSQAVAVAAIAPAAIVFEMLTLEQAALVTPDLIADADAMAAMLDWANRGWPDFAMYHPIFAAAPDAAIYGAEVPRPEASRAFAEGAAAVFGEGAARFELDLPLLAIEQSMRETAQLAAHCDALPTDILPGFVEAQRLRDARLAEAALTALADTGGPVVVITGNGHARIDWGVPALLAMAAPDVTVLSLGQLEAAPATDPPYHLWIVTDAVDRPDPCAAFRTGG